MSSIERPNCYTAEEWKKVKGQFNTDFKRYNDHIKSFNTLMNTLSVLRRKVEALFICIAYLFLQRKLLT